jgi:hypothetical protein
MLYAMIASRSSVARRWVSPNDPRVKAGERVTNALLGLPRSPSEAAVIPGSPYPGAVAAASGGEPEERGT